MADSLAWLSEARHRLGAMLLDGLDDDQRAVALAVAGPVVVYAGAGAGKTRAITHRIAHAVASGAHEARRSLAVTFTTRAAAELRSRLAGLGAEQVTASTFHAAALRQLRHFWPRAIGGEPWQVMASKSRLIGEAAAQAGVGGGSALVRDLAAEVEWAKVRQCTPDSYVSAAIAAGRATPVDARDVVAVWNAYEELKQQRAAIDFEDVLLLTVAMLADRPDIAQEVQQRYRWFTVDEYQDVNPLQHRLLRLWLGDRDDLCVVGDASQTIYTFAGADAGYLERFPQEWPQATVITLPRTYRCSPQIAAVANRVLASAPRGLQLSSQRPAGPQPEVLACDDETAEAQAVASRIAAWRDEGVALRDIAVLYRTNAQSEAFEHALAEHGLAYTVRGSERFFERAEIRRAITLLRGRAVAEPGADTVAAVREVVSGLGWSEAAQPASAAMREVWEAYLALLTLAQDVVHEEPDASLGRFLQILDARAEQQHAPSPDGVTLASLHAAKGLEWRRVIIAGCSEGMLPLIHAEGVEAIAEERRLFYVGVTRASEVLICSWARARTAGARATRNPSRFLTAIAGDDAVAAASSNASVRRGTPRHERTARGPARCRVCSKALVTGRERTLGRCESCPGSGNEALYERLVAWRLALARERSMPAYVIFTDATLLAIAEQQPATEAALLRIPGVGPKKLADFGAAVLALVSDDQAASSLH